MTTPMQPFTTIASLLCAIVLVGCSSPAANSAPASASAPAATSAPAANPRANLKMLDGQPASLLGRAVELPNHAEKSNGIGIETGQDKLLFAGDFKPFPAEVLGARIRVNGIVRQQRLPMFHYEHGDGPPPQGIPVPHGTDIAKESIYYVLENPTWELVEP